MKTECIKLWVKYWQSNHRYINIALGIRALNHSSNYCSFPGALIPAGPTCSSGPLRISTCRSYTNTLQILNMPLNYCHALLMRKCYQLIQSYKPIACLPAWIWYDYQLNSNAKQGLGQQSENEFPKLRCLIFYYFFTTFLSFSPDQILH